jgi:hypothetical protein
MDITLVVEDDVHLHIAKKVLAVTAPALNIGSVLGKRGNLYIKKNARSFNQASRIIPYIVITDLDIYKCPLELITDWLKFKLHPSFYFNIAVKEAEAWLLADRSAFAGFFGISETRISRIPEKIPDPKQYIVNIVKHSRNRAIREGVVPQGTAKVGNLYNYILEKYINNAWRIPESVRHSASLARFVNKIKGI